MKQKRNVCTRVLSTTINACFLALLNNYENAVSTVLHWGVLVTVSTVLHWDVQVTVSTVLHRDSDMSMLLHTWANG